MTFVPQIFVQTSEIILIYVTPVLIINYFFLILIAEGLLRGDDFMFLMSIVKYVPHTGIILGFYVDC